MEDHIPHGEKLLKQLCVEGGGPYSSTRAKDIHNVMELDRR